MKRFNDWKITLLLLAFMVALMLSAGSANAGFTFGTPTNLGPGINTTYGEEGSSISADGLSLYFQSDRPGGQGSWDLWVARRPTIDAEWGPPENLGPTLNTPSIEGSPFISADDLSLYFASNHPGGFGGFDLWVTTRATKADKWGIPVNLSGIINGPSEDYDASISSDGLSLYFVSYRAGGHGSLDLWVTNRATLSDLWGPPVNLGSIVNSSSLDYWPSISPDGLSLFFTSNRSGGYGPDDVYMTRRATVSDPWGLPVNLGPPVNTSADNGCPNISADGRTLYFTSDRPGGYGNSDIWQAPIIPVVDFNGDGIVNLKDFSKLAQYWGQNESSVDMGPMPLGDGRVDIQDLAVFAEYWLNGVPPVGFVAYWKLDETEGSIAHDSISNKNGNLNGNPIWQPTGGAVLGALQLDGTDDYVSTPFVLNPNIGAFSVFAWIKGGALGEVVISQTNGTGSGAVWLWADTSQGKLMTSLTDGNRFTRPLVSEFVITDGEWHQVGVVWDGSRRHLYGDGEELAWDTGGLANLVSSDGGLCLGAGKTLDAASFWSGLIDDVRIYNKAITP